jgi:hypothetical protein
MTDTIEQAITSVESTVAVQTGIPEPVVAAVVTAAEASVSTPVIEVAKVVEVVAAPEVAKVEVKVETGVHALITELEAHFHQLAEGFKVDVEKMKELAAKIRAAL